MTIIRTGRDFRSMYKWYGFGLAIKWLFTGCSSWDTNYPDKFWTFKKGEQYDYTNARLIFPDWKIVDGAIELDGWNLAKVKPEGKPIPYDNEGWEGREYLGTWWSVRFRTRWFHIYYRHRSWTKDIFYIVKE